MVKKLINPNKSLVLSPGTGDCICRIAGQSLQEMDDCEAVFIDCLKDARRKLSQVFFQSNHTPAEVLELGNPYINSQQYRTAISTTTGSYSGYYSANCQAPHWGRWPSCRMGCHLGSMVTSCNWDYTGTHQLVHLRL